AICDEVYEHIAFGTPHIPLMTLPGMAERSVRIGSAGKTFSLTGWKIGYISGPAYLIAAIQRAHQFVTFTTAINLQGAVAYGLRKEDNYFNGLAADMGRRRKVLAGALSDIGFNVLPSDGTYFLSVDFTPLGFAPDDLDFCKTITREAKVGAVPMSAFYAPERISGNPLTAVERSTARFCFSKKDEVLHEAADRLARFIKSR
ncbi:MAG: aminotransferase class I/II-fold pyridoxal phosphate-dependent enzyme, partial [Alphaproteobacteria bacterium]